MRTKLISKKNGSRIASWATEINEFNSVDGRIYPAGRRAGGFRCATIVNGLTVKFSSAFGSDLTQYAQTTYATKKDAIDHALSFVSSIVLVLSKSTLINSNEVNY